MLAELVEAPSSPSEAISLSSPAVKSKSGESEETESQYSSSKAFTSGSSPYAASHQSSLRIVSLTDSFRNVCDEGLYQMDFAVNDSDRKTIYDELTANIHSIMGKLPDRCREVFMMSRFQNMKNKEIAAALKISEKAVEKHIHKALTVFRKELDGLAGNGNADLQSGAAHLWLLFILTCMVD